jgi:hypothetical protein
MKWVTRERPKIDRLACPWLIKSFVDKEAEFFYLPKEAVLSFAKDAGAIPYDITGVELTHVGELCSFDAILTKFNLNDQALLRMADIIRAADTDTLEKSPQAPGLLAITLGLSASIPDDQELLKIGLQIYEALYIWCRSHQQEKHTWNATTTI